AMCTVVATTVLADETFVPTDPLRIDRFKERVTQYMELQRLFTTIDTHTGGNPTRTVLSGMPALTGETMSEKMLDMDKNHDWVRQILMNEPRGHDVMSGAVKVPPCHPEAAHDVSNIKTSL